MTEIEQILNDAMALPNINNGNPLRHYDDLCCHQIVILLEVVNGAAPFQAELWIFQEQRNIQNLKKTKYIYFFLM